MGGRQVDLNYRPPEVVPGKRKRWHHRIPGTWGFCFEPITGSWRNRCSMIFNFSFKQIEWTGHFTSCMVVLASLKKDLNQWNLNISFESQHDTQHNVQVEDLLHLANHNRCWVLFSADCFPAFFLKKIDHFIAWKEFHSASFWVRHIWINIGDLPLCLFQKVHHFDYRLGEGELLFLGNCAKFRKACSTSLEKKQLLHSEKWHLQASLNQHMTDYPKYTPISCLF